MTITRQGMRSCVVASLMLFCSPCTWAVNIVGGANVKTSYDGDYTVLTVTNESTLTVSGEGAFDVLLVGGGGGGGASYAAEPANGGAGGGAGGLVYKEAHTVSAGVYTVNIGAGGAIGMNGGDTTAFGLTAYGGGHGAKCIGYANASDGASGGGGTRAWDDSAGRNGLAVHGDEDNMGFDGGVSDSPYKPAGGGGAGGAGLPGVNNGGGGGTGVVCRITGRDVWYAGGGAGNSAGKVSDTTADGHGGPGGGGDAGKPGTDGFGGGGGGDARGGNGVVIVRFRRETLPISDDFALSGADEEHILTNGIVSVFRQSGTLTVTGEGVVEMLLVGGGGGGGASLSPGADDGGAGGGAGGVIFLANIPVRAGIYAVNIGMGGAVGANGGATTVFGLTACGGGYGAKCIAYGPAGDGASGGGGTKGWDGSSGKRGLAIHGAEGNMGFDGGVSDDPYRPAGGGGAGSMGLAGVSYGGGGGTGVVCCITGRDVWYAGGGAGNRKGLVSLTSADGHGGLGGGGDAGKPGIDGLGGGGGGDARGGNGVVIFRISKKTYPDKFDDATGGVKRRRGTFCYHTFMENGIFDIPHPGMVDVLLVGGGGGGGASYSAGSAEGGAGGGAGGVVWRETFFLTNGSYAVNIGAGGAVGVDGGDTTAFGLAAYGGGHGAKCDAFGSAGDGASGGGGTKGWDGSSGKRGLAIHGAEGNMGFDGGVSDSPYKPAGGGGAGGAGLPGVNNGGGGGTGVVCRITGRDVWYAGGGAGNSAGKVSDTTADGHGGPGGGGDAGKPGTDGFGGGGGGDARGGNGVVIIRYACDPRGMILSVR